MSYEINTSFYNPPGLQHFLNTGDMSKIPSMTKLPEGKYASTCCIPSESGYAGKHLRDFITHRTKYHNKPMYRVVMELRKYLEL